jgi:hypothetical protein
MIVIRRPEKNQQATSTAAPIKDEFLVIDPRGENEDHFDFVLLLPLAIPSSASLRIADARDGGSG